MESNYLNYIVIYDKVNESKLNHYESIFRVCKNSIEKNNYSLIFINNQEKMHDILCKNEALLEGMVSGKIDIYSGNNIIELLKNAFCIFYFLDNKDDFFTKNIKEIISLNKFILHKHMDKYKALINVLKDLTNNKNHTFNQNNFLNNYHKLSGTDELNLIFEEFKNNYFNNNTTNSSTVNSSTVNSSTENSNNDIKKIKLIKKVHKEENNNEENNNEENNNEEKKKEENNNEEKKEEENKSKDIKKEYKKNINIIFSKENNFKTKHVYCTFYNHTNNDITNEIQIKCMIENCKNKLFNQYIIFHHNSMDMLKNYFKNELNNDFIDKIIFIQNDEINPHILKINKVIDYFNNNYIGDIIYLSRSDILIPIQNDIKNIQFKLFETNYIYAISRIERKLDGNVFKENSFNNLLYSHLQDLYIFRTPLKIDINNEIYNQLDFYENKFEILFNKILESSGYHIINDTTNCKILRIMSNNDVNERHIMKECNIEYKDYDCSYIAENSILNKFSLENYLKNLDLNEDELYLVKQYIFKLFIKKNNLF